MRVFVHEFITSGALGGAPLPPSLLREGEAMRRAVVIEFVRCAGVEVVTTRDARVAAFGSPGLTEVVVEDAASEWEHFRTLCAESDRTLVIAPEIGNELGRRVSLAVELAGRWRVLNSPELVAVASDKWETFQRLRGGGVPTIETCLGSSDEWRRWGQVVVKPRDGAGSQGVRLVEAELVGGIALADDVIVQPFVRGRWLSCGMVFFSGGRREVLPPAGQWIADDGSFAYLGGVMPAECDRGRVQELAVGAVCALVRFAELSGRDVANIRDEKRPPHPGPLPRWRVDDTVNVSCGGEGDASWPLGETALASREELIGPVGVDLVESDSGELMVCEVNPRLTTSFVAASRLSGFDVFRGLIENRAERIAWAPGRVRFDSAGVVERV